MTHWLMGPDYFQLRATENINLAVYLLHKKLKINYSNRKRTLLEHGFLKDTQLSRKPTYSLKDK